MNGKYVFCFKYDDDSVIYQLPVPPESFVTTVGSKNKTFDLLSIGEASVIKSIPLREFSFKILLPRILDQVYCPFVQDKNSADCVIGQPVIYLNLFREYKMNQKPVRFIITRVLPDGETIFEGNILVSFEDYTVTENAGEEGDFWVDLKLREYIEVKTVVTSLTGNVDKDGSAQASQGVKRTVKDTPDSYTVVKGDTLWGIAKRFLNDGARYKEIASINNITNPDKIYPGQVFKLP